MPLFCVGEDASKRSEEEILVVESTCSSPTETSDRRRARLSVSRREKPDLEPPARASAHDMGFCAFTIRVSSGKFLVAPQAALPFDENARGISGLRPSRRRRFTELHYSRNTPEKNYLTDSRDLPRFGGIAACWPPRRLIETIPPRAASDAPW